MLQPSIVSFHANSVNGSSSTGHCSSFDDANQGCLDPTSSVLFDGQIPSLSESDLSGDTWASRLLTLSYSNKINVPYSYIFVSVCFGCDGDPFPEFGLRAEFVMFNCPEWGISVQNIVQQDSDSFNLDLQSGLSPGITSCDSLVSVCTRLRSTGALGIVHLYFLSFDEPSHIHLAELRFYNDSDACPPPDFVPKSESKSYYQLNTFLRVILYFRC